MDNTKWEFRRFLVAKMLVLHLTGGQGVGGSNPLVPTPIQNKATSHIIEGFFLSYQSYQSLSNLTLNERVDTTKWIQQG